MTTRKQTLAILIAALMLVSMFSACAVTADEEQNDETSSVEETKTEQTETEQTEEQTAESTDTTEEREVKTFTYMGSENYQWTFSFAEGVDHNWENWQALEQAALDDYGLKVDHSVYESTSYLTNLSGMMASNTLPDSFLINDLTSDTRLASIKQGKFADIDDLLEYSDGTAYSLFNGGSCQYLKAWGMTGDGHWYYIVNADGNGTSFDLDSGDRDYINNWPVHTWYILNLRQDWLDKIGMDMPTTVDEVKDALISMQENDCNGNGVADERAFLGIGTDDDNDLFSNGVSGWYGLPGGDYRMDSATGEIEMPELCGDQYLAYMSFMSELYTAGVALAGEGGAWNAGTNCAGNYASAHPMYPNSMMDIVTGDDNSNYQPVPVIQAIEGVEPRIMGQSVTTGNGGLAFAADCDYDAAGRFIDFIYGRTFYILLCYGIQGKAWDYDENGNMFKYTLSQDDSYNYGGMWHFMPWAGYPQIQTGFQWDPLQNTYTSIQSALDNGEPYTWALKTHDTWYEEHITSYPQKTWNDISCLHRWLNYMNEYGEENIHYMLNMSFTTLFTDDEVQVQSAYLADCNTYLSEMNTNFITGATPLDQYDEMVQYLYDTMHLREVMNSYQTSVNRYFVAMGREAIEVE